MFPKPSEILKAREGTLAETPFPLLLHALLLEEKSCTLELRVRGLEKRIALEDGSPVDCTSNLLHETIGKYLVEKGKLTEGKYQEILLESVQTGTDMSELLLKKGVVTPFELYKHLQANLAHKILDCFRWGDAKYRLLGEVPLPSSPIRMNTAQLILTGSATLLPFEVLTTHLSFSDEQRFALVPSAPHKPSELKLSTREAKLLQTLRKRPVFSEMVAATGLEMEDALRRLYAFCVLGLVDFAEAVQESAQPEPVEAPPAPRSPPPAAGLPFADDDDQAKNALVIAFLEHRSKDPFDLLAVPPDVPPLALRKAFLAATERFPPVRYRNPELREKAEALLVAYARAYGALTDPEQLALHRKRREVAAEAKKRVPGRPSAAEQLRIRTDLLDAGAQFTAGLARLEAGNPKGALEYFEYATEIDRRPQYRAYLAWSRYLINPQSHARLALQELGDVVRSDTACEEAYFFAGEIQQRQERYDVAEESYRLAHRANPKNRRYLELAQEMGRKRRAQR